MKFFKPIAPRHYWQSLLETFDLFFSKSLFTRSAALSYYTIFSLPPMLLVIMYTTTLFYDRTTIKRTIFGQIADWIGQKSADQLAQTVQSIGVFDGNWWLSAIGILGLLITSTTVFVTIQDTLNYIFQENSAETESGWFKAFLKRIKSFALLLSIAFVLIVSLLINALLSKFLDYLSIHIPSLSRMLILAASIVIPFAFITGLFVLIFRYLPDKTISWKSARIGAFITGFFFFLGKYAISFYIGRSKVINLYDAAGSVMVIMLWVFYASAIFFFGAQFTAVYSKKLKKEIGADK